jgi:prepilin-type N-terminal cleavage/methylation domain-containing protein
MADGRHPGVNERGETLAEILVTISIMGILFAAVLGAFAISAQTSDISRKDATAETLLRSSAEAIQNAAYVNCATTSTYAVPAQTGYTASVTAVRYWDGTAGTSASPASFGNSCTTDQGVQAIDLRVQSSDGRAVETLTVYKRAS